MVRDFTLLALPLLSLLGAGCAGHKVPPLERFHPSQRINAEQYPDVDAVVLLDKQELTYSFNAKHWQPYAELLHHRRVQILTEAGLTMRRVYIPFDDTSAVLDVVARVIHPDGSVDDLGLVPTVNFNRFAPAHPASGLYNAPAAKVFAAPSLGVGDVLEYRYRRVIKDASWMAPLRLGGPYPIARGEFALIYPKGFDVDFRLLRDERLLTQSPQRLPARVYADGQGGESQGVSASKLLWVFDQLPALFAEPLRPSDAAIATQLQVQFRAFHLDGRAFSGFAGWNDVGKWYGRLIGQADAPGGQAEALIKKIGATRDQPKRERMRRINRWLADNIVPIDFDGSLASLPVHSVGSVVATGMGDSKDIANTALSLLRTAGLEAFPVLCSRRGTLAVAPDLPSPAMFNSVVVAVPTGGGYAFFAPDGYGLPVGRLPWPVQGSQGLLIRPSGAQLVDLPADSSDDNRREVDVTLDLEADGSAQGSARVKLSGQDAGQARLVLKRLDKAAQRDFFAAYLLEAGSALRVTHVQAPAKDDGEKPLVLMLSVSAQQLAKRSAGKFHFSISDLAGRPFDFLWRAGRRSPVDVGFRFRERRSFALRMPPGMGVLQQPQDRKRANSQVSIEDHFAPADGKARMLRDRVQKQARIDPTDYEELRSLYQGLWQQQEAQFVIGPGGDRGVDYQGDAF